MKKQKMAGMLLIMVLCLTGLPVAPVQAAVTYDVNGALGYAAEHWNDGRGLCAEFVSRCVQAGGIDIPVKKGTKGCYDAICDITGLTGIDLRLNGNGYATQDLNGDILAAGDVVIQWCYTCNLRPHILICAGYNSSGNAIYYAHNAAKNRQTYRLSKSSLHKKNCNVGAKVIRLSTLAESSSGSSNGNTSLELSGIRITGMNAPSTLKTGKSWTCNGVITSDSPLEAVVGSIKDVEMNTVYTYTVHPYTTSYKMANSVIDRHLYFNKLRPGIYYYDVFAVNKNNCLWETSSPINVGNVSKPFITGAWTPDSLRIGQSWTCSGKVQSDARLRRVTGEILDCNGKALFSYTENTTAYSFTIARSTLDHNLYFNWLGAGTYYYRITAVSDAGTTQWTSKPITVR